MIGALSLLGSAFASAVSAPDLQNVEKSGPVVVQGSAHADFGQVLADVAASAVKDLKTGEATAISGLQGKATLQDVVASVMTAQQSLQTAIAVRDKAVSAYQSLSQMSI